MDCDVRAPDFRTLAEAFDEAASLFPLDMPETMKLVSKAMFYAGAAAALALAYHYGFVGVRADLSRRNR